MTIAMILLGIPCLIALIWWIHSAWRECAAAMVAFSEMHNPNLEGYDER